MFSQEAERNPGAQLSLLLSTESGTSAHSDTYLQCGFSSSVSLETPCAGYRDDSFRQSRVTRVKGASPENMPPLYQDVGKTFS